MYDSSVLILGAGVTGLAAGVASGFPIFEATDEPGGICSSYYIRPGSTQRLPNAPEDGEAYRFEIGGGHWVFGGDPAVLRFICSLAPVKSYTRHSSVYSYYQSLYVPYPLQNHLGYLSKDIAIRALTEMASASKGNPKTLADWLEHTFGKTLVELFFAPFHRLYTAGLWTRIAPQDAYKSPIDFSLVLQGAFEKTPAVGYNATFIYPLDGLNTLTQRMEQRCRVRYSKKAIWIDVLQKEVQFADGSSTRYKNLISTVPLNGMMEMCGLEMEIEPDPYTSVLVLNIGATRGPRCPNDHWLYIPDSRSGFHRVGFYSNVDISFLPMLSRADSNRVNIYVERAYPGGEKPEKEEMCAYSQAVVRELQEWGFIVNAEVVDPTWIDVAYTWSWPGSRWKQSALKVLEEHHIYQVGRYGRWVFQGIADSIKDGLYIGAAFGAI